MLSRNQERFLQALLLGKTIAASATHAGVSERTAYYWLDNPEIQAERVKRESLAAELEQQAVTHILNDGYALMHRRVEALKNLSLKLEGYLAEEDKVWLPDVKAVGTGEFAERVDLVQFNDALIREYRATFADIASELGQRVKKQAIEHTGKDGGPIEVKRSDLSQLSDEELAILEALAKKTQGGKQHGDSES